jgi:uncharacterized membrane protein
MLVICAPIAVILYLVMRNETKAKKNLIIGVTLPHDRRSDPSVTAVIRQFLRAQTVILVSLLVLLLPPLLFEYDSVVFTWVVVWIISAIALSGLPYIVCNRKLRELKSRNGWFSESTGITLVDTKLAVAPKKQLSVWVFVPTFVISLIPVTLSLTRRGQDEFWPMLIAFGSLAVAVAAFWFLYRLIYRQRAEVVDANTSLSSSLTQVRRYNWSKSWIWTAYLTSLFSLVLWLLKGNGLLSIVLTVLYSAVFIAVLLSAEFRTRRIQQKLTEESGRAVYTDDDDKWMFGMLYKNPNDSHLMVNRRTGIGMTINLAKTPGKLLIGFTVLVLLILPLTGIWMMKEETTPVALAFTNTQLLALHTGTVYTIELDAITSAHRLYGLPNGSRTNGTGMKTVDKGSFRLDGIGDCRLCLDPRVTPFIVLTSGGRTYILGSSDADETLAVLELLKNCGVPEAA